MANIYDSYLSNHLDLFDKNLSSDDKYFYKKNVLEKANLPANSKILEIGPGRGKFIEFITTERSDCEVVAIELSLEITKYLMSRFPKVNILHGEIENLLFQLNKPKIQFNLIVLFDVIEHIPKQKMLNFLSVLNDLLLSDGLLIVTTENIANPFGGRIQQYLDFTHEYNFTDRSLEYLLRSSGFEDVDIGEPDIQPPKSLKGKLKVFVQNLLYWTYKKIIETERYGLINPKFYGKSLIGFASRKKYESKT